MEIGWTDIQFLSLEVQYLVSIIEGTIFSFNHWRYNIQFQSLEVQYLVSIIGGTIFSFNHWRYNIQFQSLLNLSDCCFLPTLHYHGENKLIFNEMMRSALYQSNTLGWIFIVPAHFCHSRVIGLDMMENRMFTLCCMIT